MNHELFCYELKGAPVIKELERPGRTVETLTRSTMDVELRQGVLKRK
jgi:hypothetical protein